MGPRSVIGRPTPEGGFHGTYCHYDGYPAHQGRALFEAITGHFGGDTDAACTYLIDEHPAGWSVLHGDFIPPPGYRLPTDPDDLRNQCYCHGDRHDPPQAPLDDHPPQAPLDDHTAGDAWVDYAYVIGPDRLQVLTRLHGGWQPVADPAWTDTPTGMPSTATPSRCAASTDPATPHRRHQPATSTASTLAGAPWWPLGAGPDNRVVRAAHQQGDRGTGSAAGPHATTSRSGWGPWPG
jgi:hypothetical protein